MLSQVKRWQSLACGIFTPEPPCLMTRMREDASGGFIYVFSFAIFLQVLP